MDALLTAILLATLVKGVIDFLVQPVVRKYPQADLWWMDYVAFLCGAAVCWFAGINLLAAYIPDPMVGRVLTALVVGAGAPLINSIFGPVQGRSGAVPYRVGPLGAEAAKARGPKYRGW